jgi:hypothetical protein
MQEVCSMIGAKDMTSRAGSISTIALSSFLLSGTTAPYACTSQPQPSIAGSVVAASAILGGAVLGTVILVEVHKSHHTVKGCVIAGPNGLEVRNESDKETYALVGVTANTKVGDRVRLHGSKNKKGKNSASDRTFVVEKMSRDYGPCKLAAMAPAIPANPAGTP